MKKRIVALVLALTLLLPVFAFAELTDSQSEEAQGTVNFVLSTKDNSAYNALKSDVRKTVSLTDQQFYELVVTEAMLVPASDYIDIDYTKDFYMFRMTNDDLKSLGYLYTIIVPDTKGGCSTISAGIGYETICVAFSITDFGSVSPSTLKTILPSAFSEYTIDQSTVSSDALVAMMKSSHWDAWVESMTN